MKRTSQLFFVVCFCLFLGGVGLLTALLPKDAPAWLPEGFVPVESDIYLSEEGGWYTAYLFATDVEVLQAAEHVVVFVV